MTTPETLTWLAVALPFAGAVPIVLAHRHPDLREGVTMAVAVTLAVLVALLTAPVVGGERPTVLLAEPIHGLSLSLAVGPLGLLFALVASLLWIVTSVYSIGYMRAHKEANQTRFYACFAIALGSTIGVAFAANMLTLFVFYELLTISTYPLVTHHGDEAARRAGRTYLGILLGSSILFQLLAIVWTWSLAGTLDFRQGGILNGVIQGPMVTVLLLLYVYGVAKAAVMPLHRWLPSAMVAPTPVSALLHAVAVVKAGVFTILKIVLFIFGLDLLAGSSAATILVWIAGFTIIAASAVALRQDNLKRRLAYSTISQLSYVVLGAALIAPISVAGAIFHIAAHAVGKITLFFAAGAIDTAAHKTRVSELDGIGRRMPVTMAAFAIGTLVMVGLPPTAGFLSKWMILEGAMATRQWLAVAVIAVSTLLNASYFLPIVYRAFLRPAPAGAARHGEAPLPMLVALITAAGAAVALFFIPGLPAGLAHLAVGLKP